MKWLLGNARNRLVDKLSLLAIASLFVAYFVAAPAMATTAIEVSLCGNDAAGAQITIEEPLNDSVVSQSQVTFRGMVANATQVEVKLDGQYNSTVAIGSSVTTFQTDISLPEGTHTVTMIANALCGGEDARQDVVLTYQPTAEPSDGESTPTIVDGQQPPGGVEISDDPPAEQEPSQESPQSPFIGTIGDFIDEVADAINLTSTLSNGNVPLAIGILRVVMTVVAIALIVMAAGLAPIAAASIPGLLNVFNPMSHRSMIYLGWGIRLTGILLLLLVIFL